MDEPIPRLVPDTETFSDRLKPVRSFDRYYEDEDDGALNEQEHERRAHAHAQECTDCAPDGVRGAPPPR